MVKDATKIRCYTVHPDKHWKVDTKCAPRQTGHKRKEMYDKIGDEI